MQEKHDIFICYSRKDSAIVERYYDYLIAAGLSVWIDKDGIETGDAFKENIVDAIDNSDVFLFFSSKDSNASMWTVKEVNVAVNGKKKIMPVKLDDMSYAKSIRFDLAGLDFFDHANNGLEVGVKKLLSAFGKDYNQVFKLIKEANEIRKIEEEKKRHEEVLRQQAAVEAKKRIEEEEKGRIREEEYKKALEEKHKKEENKRRREEVERIARIEEQKRNEEERRRKEYQEKKNTRKYSIVLEEKRKMNVQRQSKEIKNTALNILFKLKCAIYESTMGIDDVINSIYIDSISNIYREFVGFLLILPRFIIALTGIALLFGGVISLFQTIFGNAQWIDTVFLFCVSISCVVTSGSWNLIKKSISTIFSCISLCFCFISKYLLNKIIEDVNNGNLHLMSGLMGEDHKDNLYQPIGMEIGINVIIGITILILIGTIICSNDDWKNIQ